MTTITSLRRFRISTLLVSNSAEGVQTLGGTNTQSVRLRRAHHQLQGQEARYQLQPVSGVVSRRHKCRPMPRRRHSCLLARDSSHRSVVPGNTCGSNCPSPFAIGSAVLHRTPVGSRNINVDRRLRLYIVVDHIAAPIVHPERWLPSVSGARLASNGVGRTGPCLASRELTAQFPTASWTIECGGA